MKSVTVVVELLDANKNVMEDQSGASLKLSTKTTDWAGFVDINAVKSGQESVLKMEAYPEEADALYLVVQNANTEVKYIRVTSVTFVTDSEASATATPTRHTGSNDKTVQYTGSGSNGKTNCNTGSEARSWD